MRISDWISDVCSSDLSAEEDALLSRAYAQGLGLTPLKQQLGRSTGSLRHRADYLQLRGSHANRNGWRLGPDWTEADERTLREDYGRPPTKEIGRASGRERVCQYG